MKKNIVIGILAVALVIAGFWGYLGNKNEGNYKTYMVNSYSENLLGLIEDVSEVELLCGKVMVSREEKNILKDLTYLYSRTISAQNQINNLPINHSAITSTSSFFNNTSGYYLSLINEVSDSGFLSEQSKSNIKEIKEGANTLFSQLSEISRYNNFSAKGFDWERDEKEWYFSEESENLLDVSLTKGGDDTSIEYPKLIYDGPFSDEEKKQEALGLSGKEITKKEAKVKVEKWIKDAKRKGEVAFVSQISDEAIPCYTFNVKEKEREYYIGITKVGGRLIMVSENSIAKEKKLTITQANKKATEFLTGLNINNMEATYYETFDNITTFNFAYVENNITCYSDLIKVKVSLEDGSVVGYEAKNYYLSHRERNLSSPKLTLKQAEEKISNDLKVTKTRLALIPNELKEEVLCYEFKGTIGEEIYLIYINANTGNEEEIFKVIEGDESVLTM